MAVKILRFPYAMVHRLLYLQSCVNLMSYEKIYIDFPFLGTLPDVGEGF